MINASHFPEFVLVMNDVVCSYSLGIVHKIYCDLKYTLLFNSIPILSLISIFSNSFLVVSLPVNFTIKE